MYLSIMGKQTDEELVKYPSVHLVSIHEWDPSVLDYSHPVGDGEALWACDPQHPDLLDLILTPMACIPRGHQILVILGWCTTTFSHGYIFIQITHSDLQTPNQVRNT